MSRAGLWATNPPQAYQSVAAALRSATPALLFGLRLWVAVCLALYIAFWLQLDNASWAGTSAAIVCQTSLGASLRKGRGFVSKYSISSSSSPCVGRRSRSLPRPTRLR